MERCEVCVCVFGGGGGGGEEGQVEVGRWVVELTGRSSFSLRVQQKKK